jgi:hypothetical protein
MAFSARRLPDDPIFSVPSNVPIERHPGSLQGFNVESNGVGRAMTGQANVSIVSSDTVVAALDAAKRVFSEH